MKTTKEILMDSCRHLETLSRAAGEAGEDPKWYAVASVAEDLRDFLEDVTIVDITPPETKPERSQNEIRQAHRLDAIDSLLKHGFIDREEHQQRYDTAIDLYSKTEAF